ncbi:MAG: prepilin-type N-terminal cleavage/methylation domain-containing protein [Planctomycetaceae bacterium]|jgi:prepilin-type N-terminal cleavage/methylation domain-containing protein|nr:prepilin-type N-terminal cleavage/methylation domain-containing protein [Planctomycetaceae bacterium]
MVANKLKYQKHNSTSIVFEAVFCRTIRVVSCGFTLVEIMISLVLMLVILGIVSASIDIYLRQMVINRTEVEEVQLARVLLDRMTQEIKSVVISSLEEEPVIGEFDPELLISIFGESAAVDNSDLSDFSGVIPIADNNSNSETSTQDEQLSEAIMPVRGRLPGIYGDVEWIQIDTVRLPRGELFGSRKMRIGSQFQTDRLSPTKTVYYYLGKDTGAIADTNDPRYQPDKLIGSLGRVDDVNAVQYGLFRREFDRQVTQYIVNEGRESEYEQYDEVIAPEVEWIEFSYFDPNAATSMNPTGDWVDYWDMDEKQTFPKAIKITIAIRRQLFGKALTDWSESTGESIPTNIYSRVVLLPVEIEEPETTSESSFDQ